MRDPLESIIEYNRALTGEGRKKDWLRIKLDRLCASPFGFLRGTFHLFVQDWREIGDDPLDPGPDQPIVGDLHLENFGAYRAADSQFVFDVNDFDESAPGTPALDLCRVATSFLLADEKHGELRALSRIDAFLNDYLSTAMGSDVAPVVAGKSQPDAINRVITEAEDGSRAAWLDRRVTGDEKKRRFQSNDKYQPVKDLELRAAIVEAVQRFAASVKEKPADCPSWPQVLDVAERIAGTGSLGRFRYAVLLPGKGEKLNKELVLELKEARPSALEPRSSSEKQADRVVAYTQLMQGDPPAYLGRTEVAGRAFTVRHLQPTEAKLEAATTKASELDQLCAACGVVLGRAHHRSSKAIAKRLAGRDRAIRRRVAAFALRYAEVVVEDHALLVEKRAKVAKAIGV
jgi:uncharacterized protein (DUF2252 family)